MMLPVDSASLRKARPLLLSTLLILVGVFGTGCGSSGVARQGGSASASASEQMNSSPGQQTAERQSEQETSTTLSDDPVKVLRLPKVRNRLEDAAQDWYGTPYEWGGESQQGVDCSGFVQNVYEDAFAYSLPRVTETQLQSGPTVSRDQIRPGDLVFFRPEGEYNHVGVYLGDGTFVHASSSEGVTESPIQRDYWDRYYWTARRPLTASSIPDDLTSELVAYKYPESDSTVQVADASESTDSQQSGTNEETGASDSGPSEGTAIASCEAEDVECADPSASAETSTESGDTRKGW